MAVAFDGEAVLSGRFAASGTWTIAGKTTAGSDRVGVLRFMSITTDPIDSVTWGGTAMTLVGTVVRGTQTIRAYRIVAPATAASDVVITFTSPATPTGPYVVTSYNTIDQVNPTSGFASATGSGTTPTVDITSATGDMVVDAMDVANVISSVGAGQTSEYLDTTGASDRFGGSREAGAATVTMSWTVSSGAWSTLGFSLNAAGGAASTILPKVNAWYYRGQA